MKKIEYNGQEIVTKHHCDLSDELFNELKADFYKKPDLKDVKAEIKKISQGGSKLTNITNYFVKDLMAKTVHWYCKWSIEDVFNCKDLLSHFVARTKSNEKMFPQDAPLIKNVETAIRLGGKGIATKPANFPIKTVDFILKKYNINGNWYDYSCGWGARLLGSLRNKVNYFGTDPNYLLCDRLNEIADLYKETIPNTDTTVDIRCSGSEVYVPEWENTMGLAFSSPPYFNLEDYKVGEQSYKEGTTYEEWLSNYLSPTLKNIHSYLIDEGYLLININNFKEFDLVSDTKRIALENGFTYMGVETLTNIKRCNMFGDLNDNSEGIMVFKKG